MHKKHTGPSPAEQAFLELGDQFYRELEKRGERAAAVFAKRALYAAQGANTMSSNTAKAIALLQTERDAVEQAGDVTTGGHLTEAIYWVLVATGQAAAPDDMPDTAPTPAADDVDYTSAEKVSKAMRAGEAGFLNVYKQVNGADIRERPLTLSDRFAQSPPRANPAAPMAPEPDTQKIAKVKGELDEARFKRQVTEVYKKGGRPL